MRVRLVVVLSTLTLLFVGCSSSGDSDESASTTVESNKPTVNVPEGAAPTELQVEELEAGDGEEILDGNYAELRYVGVLFDNGEEFSSRWDDDTFKFVLGKNVGVAGLEEGVAGMKVGARRQIIVPPEQAYGDVERQGIPANSTLVFLVEAVRTFSEPVVENVDEPATELKVEVLIESDGDEVGEGAEMVVNYTGVAQSTGEIFDSSWPRGEPSAFTLDQVIEGWQEGMLGQNVGSRVRLTIPGAKAYAETPPPGIAENDTLIFVVDILDANQPLLQVPTPTDGAPAEGSPSPEPATSEAPETTN